VSWLLRNGDVLAAAEVADTLGQRSKGLLGRAGYEGAMVLPRTRSVHTFGMKFTIEVAFCDRDLVVVAVAKMRPWRMAMPRKGCRTVIEAEAGAFERWGLRVGDRLELRG
jgi:uncharacterized protein